MFQEIQVASHPPFVMKQIEAIQLDFLKLVSSDAPEKIAVLIDEAMKKAAKLNSADSLHLLNSFHVTRYQNPLYFKELVTCSCFAVQSIQQHFRSKKNASLFEELEFVPVATVFSSALTGMVTQLDLIEDKSAKLPCILLSQHSSQTAWICHRMHSYLLEQIGAEDWKKYLVDQNTKLELSRKTLNHVATETLNAFLCDTPASKAEYFGEADEQELIGSRLMQSFLLTHEYAHIIFNHEARYSEETSLPLSAVRLRNLQRVLDPILEDSNSRIPINSRRLSYFFGEQQDELEADFLAFSVLYHRIANSDDHKGTLGRFFRAVAYSIMWSDIDEVIGRTITNGGDWASSPLHSPDLSLVGDLMWRRRYPSAHSRLSYLFERAQKYVDQKHKALLEEQIHEVEVFFSIWRRAMLAVAGELSSIWREDSPNAQAVRDHFVWKGLPNSVRSSVGYRDHRDTFEVHNLSEF